MMNPRIENAKVLVTGGAGFIGSNLVEVLLHQGNEVVCLDNLLTGKRKNIEQFLGYSNFRFIEGDIRNPGTCRTAVKGMDFVLHQAALGSVPRSIKDPVATNDININGFLNMLVASRDEQVRRFIYAVSSSTYGDSDVLPKVEDRIGKPLSPYAVTKYVNELYAHVFSRIYGLESIGLRYFNVFGKRQDPEGPYAAVIPKFIRQITRNEPPIIHGDGTQSRDFTYIDNVIRVNQLAALTDKPEALNTVYNVAYGERTTLNELFNILVGFLSKYVPGVTGIKPKYGPAREGDIPHSYASIDKAKELLGYSPEYSLKDGLEKTIKWYWKNLR